MFVRHMSTEYWQHLDADMPDFVQGVLGYVILRPLMTAVGVVAQLLGVYGDGKLRFDCVYLYTTIISNVSQVGRPV